jgi:TolB-like protein
LSILVLPFASLSSDPEQEYFTDGTTDDLTTDLSRIAGSFAMTGLGQSRRLAPIASASAQGQ